MTEDRANYLHAGPPGIHALCTIAAALLVGAPALAGARRTLSALVPEGNQATPLPWFLTDDAPGLAAPAGEPTRAGAPRPAREDLTPAEQLGLARLAGAVHYELAPSGWSHSELEWMVEATLYQLARLIRTGAPITVPSLGTFRRLPRRGMPGYVVDFAEEPMLVEDGL